MVVKSEVSMEALAFPTNPHDLLKAMKDKSDGEGSSKATEIDLAMNLLGELKEEIDQAELVPALVNFYHNRFNVMKGDIDELAAEIHQRQDKMRLINELMTDINNLTDKDSGALDFSKNPELQEKLKLANALGANINVSQSYDINERVRLIENLHLKADEWDKDNRTQIQKLESKTRELDRILMMVKEVQKCDDRMKRSCTAGIKGN